MLIMKSAKATWVFLGAAILPFLARAYGADIPINSTTAGDQHLGNAGHHNNRIASDANGNFAVVFMGPTTVLDVYVRLFDSTGAPTTGEILVNAATTGPQEDPRVAMADNGQFVVVWRKTNDKRVIARFFNASGQPITGDINVSPKGSGSTSYYPLGVASDADGDTVATYGKSSTSGITFLVQRYNSAGVAQGSAIAAETTNNGSQTAAVDMDANGNFVFVSWDFAQRYLANGTPIGSHITYKDAPGRNGAVAVADDGRFVIAWPGDTGTSGLWAQTFNADGTRITANNFQYATGGGGSNSTSSVACDHAGNAIVFINTSGEVLISRYDFLGNVLTPEFQLNTTPLGFSGVMASVIDAPNEGFVATWDRVTANPNRDVFGQVWTVLPGN